MLRKLLKYDLKSIFKVLIIFYILAMLFGVLTRVFFSFENSLMLQILGEIAQGAAISMMCSTLINNIMRMWVRFKAHFYSDESYLTHTLPVEKSTHYLSKILTTIINLFTSFFKKIFHFALFCVPPLSGGEASGIGSIITLLVQEGFPSHSRG